MMLVAGGLHRLVEMHQPAIFFRDALAKHRHDLAERHPPEAAIAFGQLNFGNLLGAPGRKSPLADQGADRFLPALLGEQEFDDAVLLLLRIVVPSLTERLGSRQPVGDDVAFQLGPLLTLQIEVPGVLDPELRANLPKG